MRFLASKNKKKTKFGRPLVEIHTHIPLHTKSDARGHLLYRVSTVMYSSHRTRQDHYLLVLCSDAAIRQSRFHIVNAATN